MGAGVALGLVGAGVAGGDVMGLVGAAAGGGTGAEEIGGVGLGAALDAWGGNPPQAKFETSAASKKKNTTSWVMPGRKSRTESPFSHTRAMRAENILPAHSSIRRSADACNLVVLL